MSDLKYTVEVAGTDGIDRLEKVIDKLHATLNAGKGSGKSLEEVRKVIVGLKGSEGIFKTLDDSIRSLATASQGTERAIKESVGGLVRVLQSEMTVLRQTVSTAGFSAGAAAANSLAEGFESNEAKVVKEIKGAAAKARAAMTAEYNKLVDGDGFKELTQSQLGTVDMLRAQGASISAYHKELLSGLNKTYKESLRESDAAQKAAAAQSKTTIDNFVKSIGADKSAIVKSAKDSASVFLEAFALEAARGKQVFSNFEKAVGLDKSIVAKSAKESAGVFLDAFALEAARGKQVFSSFDKVLGLDKSAVAKSAKDSANVFLEAFALEAARGKQVFSNFDNALGINKGVVAKSAKESAGVFLDAFALEAARGKQIFSSFDKVLGLDKSAVAKSAKESAGVFLDAFALEAARGKQVFSNFEKAVGLDKSIVAKSAKESANVFLDAFALEAARGKQIFASFDKVLGLDKAAVAKSAKESASVFTQAYSLEIAKSKQQLDSFFNSIVGLDKGRVAKSAKESAGVFALEFPDLSKKAAGATTFAKSLDALTLSGNNAHSMARGLASGFNLLWLTWGKLGPLFAGASISFGIKKTFDIGSEVEYLIKFMETLGHTVDDTGKKMEHAGSIIRSELRAIDQTTLFSMTELSKSMVSLGQAGFSSGDALKILRPSADLAAVGMTDLDTATKLLIQTNALFGKSVEDTGKVAAQIFAATKAGVLDVEDISGSMKYASEANTRFGKSVEEVLTVLAALAKAGLKGSSGGTALINFYRDLNGRSGPAIKALKDLEKATGDTIKVFDEFGKQRSGIDIFNDIAEASGKLKAADADKILAKIFSDRGGRAFFAMIRDGTISLKDFQRQIEETKPEDLFEAAKGLMDTTKGALNILQGAMVGAFDEVFESYSDGFKGFIHTVTDVISSSGFKTTLAAVVDSALGLFNTLKDNSTLVTTFIAAWGGFKVIAGGVAAFKALGLAVAGTMPTLYAAQAAYKSKTLAVGMTTQAMVVQAATSRAVAAGMTAEAAAAYANTTAQKVLATQVGVTAGAMRVLGATAAFLANPIVGLVTTVGLLGYGFLSAKRNAEQGMGGVAAAVQSDGTIIKEELIKQISLARQRNLALGQKQDPFWDEQARVDAELVKNKQRRNEALSKLDDAAIERDPYVAKAASVSAQRALNIVNKNAEALEQAQEAINAGRREVEEKRIKEEEERNKKEREALAKHNADMSKLSLEAGSGGRGQKTFERVDVRDDNELKALQAHYDAVLSVQLDNYNRSKKLLDAQRDGELVSQADFIRASNELALNFEFSQIETLKAGSEETLEVYAKKYADLAKLRDSAKSSEAKDSYSSAMERMQNNTIAQMEKNAAAIEKVTNESNERITLSYIKLEAAVGKLQKEDKAFWTGRGLEEKKKADAFELAKAYSNINTSLFSAESAMVAQAKAQQEVTAAVAANIEKLKEELTIHEAILEAQRASIDDASANPNVSAEQLEELSRAAARTENAVKRIRGVLKEATEKGLAEGSRAGMRAFSEERFRQMGLLRDDFALGVYEGLTKRGKEAGQRLRNLLQEELYSKPMQVAIRAVIGEVLGMGNGREGLGSTGFGGLQSVLGGNTGGLTDWSSWGGKAGDWLMSQSTSLGLDGMSTLSNATFALGNAVKSADTYLKSIPGMQGGIGSAAGYLGSIYSLTQGQYGSAIGSAIGTWALPGIGTMIGSALGGLFDGLDDSGTPHMGGSAMWSSATGGKTNLDLLNTSKTDNPLSNIDNQFGSGFGWVEDRAEVRDALGVLAKGMGSSLDSFAKSFGSAFGYEVALGFADDTSKDGSWGALRISLDGQDVVNWNDSRQSKWAPRSFSDGEEGYRQFLNTIFQDYKTALSGIDLSAWAAQILEASTDIDTINAALQQIGATRLIFDQLGQSMQMFSGISGDLETQLLKASGGIENLSANAGTFYQSFFDEKERMEALNQQLRETLSGLDLSIDPAMGDAAKEQFRAAVEAAMSGGQGELVSQLLAMSGTFATAADAAQKSMSDMAAAAEELSQNLRSSLTSLEAQFSGGGFSRQYRAEDAAKTVQQLLSDVGISKDLGTLTQTLLSATSADVESYFREIWEVLDTDAARRKLVDVTGAMLNLAEASESAADKSQVLGERITSALTAMNSAGSLLDRIDGALGGAGDSYSLLREQRLWAAMAEADYKTQIDLAGQLTDSVLSRYQLEQQAAQKQIDFARSLRSYVDGLKLGNLSPLTTGEKLAEAARQYQQTLSKAQTGDAQAMNALQGISSSYLDLARQYYASSDAYTQIFGNVTGSLDALGIQAQTEAQQQLTVSSQSLDQLRTLQGVLESAYVKAEADYTVQRELLQAQIDYAAKTATGIDAMVQLLAGLPAEIGLRMGGSAGDSSYAALAQQWVNLMQPYGLTKSASQVASEMSSMTAADLQRNYEIGANLLGSGAKRDEWDALIATLREDLIDGSHAGGLDYVPFDGYIAQLHKGERVMTAAQNRAYTPTWSDYGAGDGMSVMAAEIKSLNSRIDKLTEQNERLMLDHIRATVESNHANAERVVQGIGQSTERAAYAQSLSRGAEYK